MKRNVGVAAVGDVLDIRTWSSTPYFFYEAGSNAGLFNEPWRLDPTLLRNRRILWNLARILAMQEKGGYQYSTDFLDKAEAMIPKEYFSSTIISFNQLFPRASTVKKAGGKIYYYIDAPLLELFNADVYGIRIPHSMQERALQLEKENYSMAEAVVGMGTWIFPALKDFYQLPENKIRQILPGANVKTPQGFLPKKFQSEAGASRTLKLGFIGKDWKRKGLPLIVDVADGLKAKGVDVKIVIIGNSPDELAGHPLIENSGFIDKSKETEKFLATVSSCDIGCVFSTSEALGISALEFLRCGVPVAGYYHQGMVDTLIEGASLRFQITDSTEIIINTIASLVNDQRKFESLANRASEVSDTVTWDVCVNKWRDIIQ